MQYRLIALLGLALLTPVSAQPPTADKKTAKPAPIAPKLNNALAKKLLRRMVQAELSHSFLAQEVTVGRDGRTIEQWVKHDPKRGLRRESIKPGGILLIDNRRRQFLVQDKEKRYHEGKSQLAEIQKRFQAALKAGAGEGPLLAEYQGQDTIAGRPTDVLSVHLKQDQSGPSRRFWVDRETGLRLRTEERAPDGRILSNTYYLTLDLNPTFKDEEFAPPSIPAGFRHVINNQKSYETVEDAYKEGVVLKQPSWLPAGFTLRGITAIKGNRPQTTINWGNGLTVISLVSAHGLMPPVILKALNGMECGFFTPPPPKGERTYARKTPEGYTLVIGNLPDDQLKRIADSIR